MTIHIFILTALTVLWIAFEIALIVRDKFRGKGKTTRDRGTIYINFVTITAGMTIAGFLGHLSQFYFPGGQSAAVFYIGVAVMLLGLALRVWSIITLGASFRTTVEIDRDQQVMNRGPYRLIRHPSYSGLLLICCGYGIAIQNWLSLLIVIVLPLAALLYRIRIEEAVLVSSLGPDYVTYKNRTKKLIPWIW